MIETTVPFPWQLAGGFLTLITIILTLYIFVLNPRRQANRLVSLATALLAVTSVGIILAIRANTFTEGVPALVILAAVVPATGPALILATLGMLKPQWIKGRMGWLWFVIMILTLVPVVLTAIDRLSGSGIYLAMPDPVHYSGGYLEPAQIVRGMVGQVIVQADLLYSKIVLLILCIYLAYFEKPKKPTIRGIARYLLVVLVISWLLDIFLESIIPNGLTKLLSGALITVGYVFAGYRHMVLTRSLQSGRVQARLTTLIAIITTPLVIFVAWFLLGQAEDLLEEKSSTLIENQTVSLNFTVDRAITGYVTALQNLARQPEILSMDPTRQKPVLDSMADTYSSMYLISTVDLSGMNVARSDDNDLADYRDREWYQQVINGAEYSLQSLVGRTTGQPALVAAVPIVDGNEQIVGVCMCASLLTEISNQVLTANVGETGYAYVVDDQDQLVVHPDIVPGSVELVDFSAVAPVAELREGRTPPIIYMDEKGVEWLAYFQPIENGWGVVVQQQTKELLGAVQILQQITVGTALVGSLLLLGLVGVTIRQTVQPINSLTQTVKEVASGDLNRVAPIESDDEFGTLAKAFNSMTLQVRNLVDDLERRVAERTLDLEHRSAQLQAAAEVGRATANIRNLGELLPLVTRLVSERFGFYHVGIFLLDENLEYAVLRAANSEGGKRMLERGHKLRVGQQGIVGFVSQHREPRIALNVGEDAVFFSNPDLPQTQSEMALPLVVGSELLGVLDVQSTEQSAFTDQDVRTLQVLADQVAIAIHSARLVQQLEQVLEEERQAYGEISQQAWREQIRGQEYKGFSRTQGGVIPIREIKDVAVRNIIERGDAAIDRDNAAVLYMPVKVRGVVIGILKLTRLEQGGSWSSDDLELTEKLAEQLGVALESARAYQTTQISAQRDKVLAEISTRVRETLDIEAILRATSQEVRRALGVPKVIIQLGVPERINPSLQNGSTPNGQEGGNPPAEQVGDDAGTRSQGGSHE
jgi:GAF domain-containing protein/HAMP domain-containing protein